MKTLFSLALLTLLAACSSSEEGKKTPIAILTPVTHPSLEEIERGFREEIEAKSPGHYRFVTYNAQGNQTLMRGEIEEIAQKGYPLIFTIGTLSSQMTSEVFAKKGVTIPIVFTCVPDPIASHLVEPDGGAKKGITGVQELVDFRQEIDHLLAYHPSLSTLLLVLNPMEPGIAQNGEEVREIAREKGITLLTAEVFQVHEITPKVSPLIHRADALLVLKDNTVVSGLDPLIKLSYEHQIPLLASDLDSPDRGATFGYGVHEVEFGIEGAKKALQILEENRPPESLPVTPVSGFSFKVNREAAIAQGIPLLEESP